MGDEAVDGALQFIDGSEYATLEAAVREFGEEAFDRIEPGGRGWGEVEGPTRALREPFAYFRVLVSGVIVDDRMYRLSPGNLLVDVVEKAMNS